MLKFLIKFIAKHFNYHICPCCQTINPKNLKYCKNCGRINEMPTDYEEYKKWEKKYYGRK